jgi:hypothetical protein
MSITHISDSRMNELTHRVADVLQRLGIEVEDRNALNQGLTEFLSFHLDTYVVEDGDPRVEGESKELEELQKLAREILSFEDSLDDTCHQLASGHGSSANNGGIDGQVEYILEECGFKRAKELIEEAAAQ